MAYSTDLRKRVLDFITNGGSKAAAERTFGVSRRTIYNWLAAEDPFAYEKPGPKGPRSIDYEVSLGQHVADFPDNTLAERAKHFGVSEHGIFYALTKLNITRKKTQTYKEQCPVKREAYLCELHQEEVVRGKHPVYIDETGFSEEDFRRYA